MKNRFYQLLFTSIFLALSFFAIFKPSQITLAAEDGACFCTKTINGNETDPFLYNGIGGNNGKCTDFTNAAEAQKRGITEPIQYHCALKPSFCCCKQLLGGRVACSKSAAHTETGTQVCNQYSFNGRTEGFYEKSQCVCTSNQYSQIKKYSPITDTACNNQVSTIKKSITNDGILWDKSPWWGKDLLVLVGGISAKVIPKFKETTTNQATIGVSAEGKYFAQCHFQKVEAWSGSQNYGICTCEVITPPREVIMEYATSQLCSNIGTLNADKYSSCQYYESNNLQQSGYEIRPVQPDNTCFFDYDTGFGDQTLRNAASKLNASVFSSPIQLIAQGIQILLLFIGSLGLVLYIYAGILWMTAAGNAEQITKAKEIIIWTTVGLAAMLGSRVVVKYVFSDILKLY